MGGVAGQVKPLMMHRFDDAYAQVKQIALHEWTLREFGFPVGVQPLLQLWPDPFIGPRVNRVSTGHLKHETSQRRAPLHLAGEPRS